MRTLLGHARRLRINRTASLQTSGFAAISAAAGVTFGAGALLLAAGVSLLVLAWLSEPDGTR